MFCSRYILVNSKDRVAPGISNISDLEEVIVNESDGVFLWVSIVLRHVEDGLANGDQLRDLVRLVRSLPNDLEPSKCLPFPILILMKFCACCIVRGSLACSSQNNRD